VIRERVAKAAEAAHTLLKAVIVGADIQDPASLPGGEDADFASAGAIPPPYDPAIPVSQPRQGAVTTADLRAGGGEEEPEQEPGRGRGGRRGEARR
jgi:hypothetical protein